MHALLSIALPPRWQYTFQIHQCSLSSITVADFVPLSSSSVRLSLEMCRPRREIHTPLPDHPRPAHPPHSAKTLTTRPLMLSFLEIILLPDHQYCMETYMVIFGRFTSCFLGWKVIFLRTRAMSCISLHFSIPGKGMVGNRC